MNSARIPETIDEYILSYPEEIRGKLRLIRETIRKAAPDAEEKISYRMPAYAFKGMLVYFAAHTRHIGFYPFTTVMKEFRDELNSFTTSKGGIQFPYKDPLPVDLIRRIVEYRVRENCIKAEAKVNIKNRKDKVE